VAADAIPSERRLARDITNFFMLGSLKERIFRQLGVTTFSSYETLAREKTAHLFSLVNSSNIFADDWR
jgi:hypothetical protein